MIIIYFSLLTGKVLIKEQSFIPIPGMKIDFQPTFRINEVVLYPKLDNLEDDLRKSIEDFSQNKEITAIAFCK